jgi:hypothetical protein
MFFFSRVFILWFVFLYDKNVNMVLKYLIFYAMLQIYMCVCVCLSMHFSALITSLLKS